MPQWATGCGFGRSVRDQARRKYSQISNLFFGSAVRARHSIIEASHAYNVFSNILGALFMHIPSARGIK